MRKSPTITIGIPTYESGPSLATTVASIRSQTVYSKISKIFIVVDGKKMSPVIRKKINLPKVTVVQRTRQIGQSGRIQDIFSLASSDLLILTNDDVELEKNAVDAFIKAYRNANADFFTGVAIPFRGESFLRHALAVSYTAHRELVGLLRGRTYLSANGRLIALTKALYKKAIIPRKIQNNDAYLYFFSILNGFTHKHVPGAKVFFHSPKTFKEHLKQSRKFQLSQKENQQFFSSDLEKLYKIPPGKVTLAFSRTFLRQPILTSSYLFILFVSRLRAFRKDLSKSGIWETDISTKVA